MIGHQQGWAGPWMWVLVLLVLAWIGALLLLLASASRRSEGSSQGDGRPPRTLVGTTAIAIVVLVMATGGVAIVAVRSAPRVAALTAPTCRAPNLPGSTLDVTLADMGGMMNGRMPAWRNGQLMPGGPGMMGSMPGETPFARMMTVMVNPAGTSSGTVSFRVWNSGTITHELVIMPMPPGGPGSRGVGSDGKVSEDGSLGESSRSCSAGIGDGIESGAQGWVTVQLAPGSYELICNLPGHYAMGMYAGLSVT